MIDPQTGAVINSVQEAEVTATPTPAVEDTTTSRLESFFRFWSANKQDEMLTLCSPSWQSSVDNPKTALFGLLKAAIELVDVMRAHAARQDSHADARSARHLSH